MDYIESLERAKEQFLLSLHVRAICSGPGGSPDRSLFDESRLTSVSLGPFHNIQGLKSINLDRAAESSEIIATQHLAVSLDTALENVFGKTRLKKESNDRDYFTLVRCLRNAFSHNPYKPEWCLKDPAYKRLLQIEGSWEVDLTNCHGSRVEPQQYLHASGLIRLIDRGIALVQNS